MVRPYWVLVAVILAVSDMVIGVRKVPFDNTRRCLEVVSPRELDKSRGVSINYK